MVNSIEQLASFGQRTFIAAMSVVSIELPIISNDYVTFSKQLRVLASYDLFQPALNTSFKGKNTPAPFLITGAKHLRQEYEPNDWASKKKTRADEIDHWFELSQQEGIRWNDLAQSDWVLKLHDHSHRNSLQLEVEHLGAALLSIK